MEGGGNNWGKNVSFDTYKYCLRFYKKVRKNVYLLGAFHCATWESYPDALRSRR